MRSKRELLTAYLVDGKSVRDIALENDLSQSRIRALLAQVSISVPPDKIRDEICETLAHRGFGSFAGYIRKRGLATLDEQAKELGVSTSGLNRLYELLRELSEEEPRRTERGAEAPEGEQGQGR
jgi:hypothetical protein